MILLASRLCYFVKVSDMGTQLKLATIDAVIEHETEKAYLLDFAGKCGPKWVPKSVTEDNDDGTFTLPEKMAMEKGMI